ncbi:DNA polymerase III subunit delta' [Pseudovibrio sp. SPO723]|uniref:DNA polymerase III subunit delta' n=1 Tax=Nesiotobacter zosterae TaxID=392721 RepID=UPI0029C256E3|nr:DNA polymerase III subunit delta' [Pseudovibrio sp. SPO723]MDX5593864.1 DNA polymerase III subunit delta' [Pseudovibrio sp. SPO723]
MARAPAIQEIPILDSIDGVPLPREHGHLFGHKEAEQELLDAYRSTRMHHAWILGGPKGVGKATLAFRFARFVLTHPDRNAPEVAQATSLAVPEDSHAARMIAAGSHADLLHLKRPWDEKGKRFKKELPVDEVRRTVSFFGSTSAGGTWRICIVDAADDMNASAANALLKVLEEPPERCLFLVLSHNPGRLLPTIRSRCRRLELRRLENQEMYKALHTFGFPPDSGETYSEALMAMADGSPRHAMLAIGGEGQEVATRFFQLVSSLPHVDMSEGHRFADLVASRGADDAWATFLDLARSFLSEQVRKDAQHGARSLVRWAEVWEKVGQAAAAADALNLDRKQVVLNFLKDLRG